MTDTADHEVECDETTVGVDGLDAEPIAGLSGAGAQGVRHLVSLAGDWALWRDFAVRSAGFTVSGLDLFGAGDESAQLAEVAADPQFADAVIWQNRSAYRTAVAKIAGRGTQPGNRRRQRDGVVAGYWQRYCSKNDTIGFFGPLAWGTIRDDGPALAVHSRGLLGAREVHFETWCLEALARMIDPSLVVPLNRRPEIELRLQLERRGLDAGLQQLARLEAARAAVCEAAGGEALLAALDAFDACFEELTGAQPIPTEERAEGGRTPLYLDCMRDLDVELGPALVAELATTLPLLLEASRWWCGRAFAHSREVIAEALADGPAEMPLGPLYGRVFDALWQLPGCSAPTSRSCNSGVPRSSMPTTLPRSPPAPQRRSPTTGLAGRCRSTTARTCSSPRRTWRRLKLASFSLSSATSTAAPTRCSRACSPPASPTRTVSERLSMPTSGSRSSFRARHVPPRRA